MKTAKDPRHIRREKAIKFLFGYSFKKTKTKKLLARSIINKRKEIDQIITKSAPEWPIKQINRVDLAILRLAVFELVVKPKEPPKVIIDEAVELAKRFGSEKSPSFVNGVLGTVLKKMAKLKQLENLLGIKFDNSSLLAQAVVHRSYLNEAMGQGITSNERMEFLGDAVLEFVISLWLYEKYPDYPEGVLTNLRSNLVRTSSLAEIAQKLELGEYLLMSKGEKDSEGNQNPSILADTLEAIIGAIFLDQGMKSTQNFIKKYFSPLIKIIEEKGEFKDAKSLLQERLQAESRQTPVYKTLKEVGPDHDKIFTVGVYLGQNLLAKGRGKSKQAAEEKAAQKALKT